MSGNKDEARKEYGEMTVEELERELREVFFCTDRIDGPLSEELERIREALEQNARPRPHALLRGFLIAAALVVLLAGAALAADSLGLWAWVPRWNAAAGRYEPAGQEASGESPIPAALAELGITEPVYPAKLPEGFVITESHISEEPLVLMEQYAKGDRLFSLTVTPIKGFKSAVYPAEGVAPREYGADQAVHYLFKNGETIIAVRYTDHYATTVSGNISLDEIEWIMDSFGAPWEGGSLS